MINKVLGGYDLERLFIIISNFTVLQNHSSHIQNNVSLRMMQNKNNKFTIKIFNFLPAALAILQSFSQTFNCQFSVIPKFEDNFFYPGRDF